MKRLVMVISLLLASPLLLTGCPEEKKAEKDSSAKKVATDKDEDEAAKQDDADAVEDEQTGADEDAKAGDGEGEDGGW